MHNLYLNNSLVASFETVSVEDGLLQVVEYLKCNEKTIKLDSFSLTVGENLEVICSELRTSLPNDILNSMSLIIDITKTVDLLNEILPEFQWKVRAHKDGIQWYSMYTSANKPYIYFTSNYSYALNYSLALEGFVFNKTIHLIGDDSNVFPLKEFKQFLLAEKKEILNYKLPNDYIQA